MSWPSHSESGNKDFLYHTAFFISFFGCRGVKIHIKKYIKKS